MQPVEGRTVAEPAKPEGGRGAPEPDAEMGGRARDPPGDERRNIVPWSRQRPSLTGILAAADLRADRGKGVGREAAHGQRANSMGGNHGCAARMSQAPHHAMTT